MTLRPSDRTVGRLKSRPQFLAVRAGEQRKGPLFLLEVLDRKAPHEGPRVGFTVTKKHGNAVERNRMRRRLKEAVRLVAGFAMKPGQDYVIVARRDVLAAPFERLTKGLRARIEAQPDMPDRRTRNAPGRNASGPTTSGPKTSGPKTSGPKTSGKNARKE